MGNCYLCQQVKNEKYILWENNLLFATFDTCPVSAGHVLLSPKRHVAEFKKLTVNEFTQIKKTIQSIVSLIEPKILIEVYEKIIHDNESEQSVWFCQKALERAKMNIRPSGYNHGFNDGKAAGRTVNHFHWHIIPRYEGDIKNSIGGVRFVIPEMGDYISPRR